MKIKISELTGKALDWAVARATGKKSSLVDGDICLPNSSGEFTRKFSPSTDWSQCGQLIEAFLDSLTRMCIDSPWVASCKAVTVDDFSIWKVEIGETPQIALCRAVVSAKLGDEVEIPDELLEAK
jgi:hypothetical protein